MEKELFQLHADVEQRHWWFVGRRAIMKSLVNHVLPPRNGAMVVDVGCGTGANIAALAGQYDCIGIDTSEDAIRLARIAHPGVRFLHGYAPADLGDAARTADMFLLMDVIEHVPDDFMLLSSVMSAAKTGALFLVTVPADMSLWSPHDVAFKHYRRYDTARLQRIWQGLPAETLLLSYFNARLLPVVRAIRTINRMRGETLGAEGTDLSIPAAPANRALTSIFTGERNRLQRVMSGQASPYAHGVSLMGIFRKTGDGIVPFSRPADVAPDLHDPER